jgi:hypothetical protein
VANGPAMSPIIRSILNGNINLTADEVIKRVKMRGVTAPDKSIRQNVHTIKSELRRTQAAKALVAPAAARETALAPAKPAPAPKPAVATKQPVTSTATPTVDLSGVFSTVVQVNKVVDACGGVEQAKQVADAVRACGGVEAFLKHLELVAGIRNGG